MIEISNRHFDLLIEKLPRLLDMVRKGQAPTTLRQQEDLLANMAASWATEKEKKYNK